MQAHDIIIKSIVSEKSLKDASAGKYTFLVNKKATKTDIKKAIENVFEVKVTKIMTNITKGSKTKNTRAGKQVTEFADKKARVMLSKGQSISIFNEHLGIDDKEKSKDEKAKNKDKKEVKTKEKEVKNS
jgi:large subunit ribosomal protein L23